jgi:hypothetical protein
MISEYHSSVKVYEIVAEIVCDNYLEVEYFDENNKEVVCGWKQKILKLRMPL